MPGNFSLFPSKDALPLLPFSRKGDSNREERSLYPYSQHGVLARKHPILLPLSTGLDRCSNTRQTIMFSSGLDLFEALFHHNSTALPLDAFGDASAGNIEEYQLVASTHWPDPNSEVQSFPPDHVNYYASSESEDDFSYRLQIEDRHSGEFHDGEEQSYEHYENWPVNQVLYHSNCWEEYYSSPGDNTSEDTYVNTVKNLQDLCLGEDGYASHFKDVENQDQFSFALSGFESWFEEQYKEHHPNYDLQQPRNSVANWELCESIFGYWPCMFRNDQQMFCDSA